MRPEGVDEWFRYQACPTYPRNKKEKEQNGTLETRHTYPSGETEKTAFAMETAIMRRRVVGVSHLRSMPFSK